MAVKSWQVRHFRHALSQAARRYAPFSKRLLAALCCSVLVSFAWMSGPGQDADIWSLRRLFALRGPIPPPQEVVIVALDDLTYKKLDASPRWPFPRKHFAQAMENLLEADPKVIILDLAAQKEDQDEEANKRIEHVLASGRFSMVTGFFATTKGGKVSSNADGESVIYSDPRFLEAVKVHLPMMFDVTRGAILNIALTPDGSINAPQDLHYFPLLRPLREIAGLEAKVPGLRDLINFYGPAGHMQNISLFELIQGDLQHLRQRLKDKVVLVGYQSYARMRGQMDKEEFFVGYSPEPMYGVEVHANVTGNLLDGSSIKRLDRSTELNIIFLFSAYLVLACLTLPLFKALAAVAAAIVLYLIAVYLGFIYFNTFIPGAVAVSAAMICCLLPVSLIRIFEEQKFAKMLKASFGFED